MQCAPEFMRLHRNSRDFYLASELAGPKRRTSNAPGSRSASSLRWSWSSPRRDPYFDRGLRGRRRADRDELHHPDQAREAWTGPC